MELWIEICINHMHAQLQLFIQFKKKLLWVNVDKQTASNTDGCSVYVCTHDVSDFHSLLMYDHNIETYIMS